MKRAFTFQCLLFNKKLLVFYLFYLLSIACFAQNTVLVKGYVNNEAGQPIPNVTVINNEINSPAITNKQGYFEMQIDKRPMILKFSCLGFKAASIPLLQNMLDTLSQPILNIHITLNKNINELKEFTLHSTYSPEIAYSKPDTYVLDYDIVENGILLLVLEYHGIKRTEDIRLVDFEQHTLINYKDLNYSDALYKDCSGNMYAMLEWQVFPTIISKDSIKQTEPLMMYRFKANVCPCVAETPTTKFYNFEIDHTFEKYACKNKLTNDYKIFFNIKNEMNRKIMKDLRLNKMELAQMDNIMGDITTNGFSGKEFSTSTTTEEIRKKAAEIRFLETVAPEKIYDPLKYQGFSLYF